MKINVMLVSKQERNLTAMRQLIIDDEIAVVGESEGGATALDKIENISPDIIIMTLSAGDTDVLNLAERVILYRPMIHVVLLTEYMDINILQSAMKIGVHNIIEYPKNAKDFSDYVKSVYHNETARIKALNQKQNLSWMSRVITVFGAKGGLGKTTIACNLAVKLAANNKKVALIDLDLQFGDTHIFLDIDPKDTIAELMNESFAANIDVVRSFMTVHSSGIHVLCAPKSPEYAEMISAEKIHTLISLMRAYYDYVIIDTSPFFNEVTMNAIESSSNVLFVTGLDISILKNSKLSLSLLNSLQQTDKVRLIINRAVEMSSIKISDVQEILGYPIWAKLPSDYKVAVTSLNRGIPFVLSDPNSKIAQSIDSIANILLNGEESVAVGLDKGISHKKRKLFGSKRK